MKSQIHASKSQIHASKKSMLLLLTLFLGGTVYAQENELQSIYVSPEDMPVAGILTAAIYGNTLDDLDDADGDGVSDLIMITEDDNGDLQDLLVVQVNEARPRGVIWEVEDVQATLGIKGPDLSFIGFSNVFGGDVRHAIFVGNLGVSLFDPHTNLLAWEHVHVPEQFPVLLQAVTDVTGDGLEDLILFLPDTEQVEVWSSDH